MLRSITGILGAAVLACLPGPDARAQNPITGIAGKMSTVVHALAEAKTDQPVQTRQQEIIQDLDELIAALEQECAACRDGIKRNNPMRGMDDSRISAGTGGIGDLIDPGQSEKDWATLSARERDRILQSMSEGFPAEYRTVLERYYRRLAEETTAGSVGAPTPSEPAGSSPDEDRPEAP